MFCSYLRVLWLVAVLRCVLCENLIGNEKADEDNFVFYQDLFSKNDTEIHEDVLIFDTEENKWNKSSEVNFWSQWTGYSHCSASCGGGRRILRRYCSGDIAFHCHYDEDYREETCNNHPCENTQKETFGKCSNICGRGFKKKFIGTNHTAVNVIGWSLCKAKCSADWSEWTGFTECTQKCGQTQSRQRHCLQMDIIVDKKLCKGENVQTRPCPKMGNRCVYSLSEWSLWSPCNGRTCNDTGQQIRSRRCMRNFRTVKCRNELTEERRVCQTIGCDKVELSSVETWGQFWSQWSDWPSCPCGQNGVSYRNRICLRIVKHQSGKKMALHYKQCPGPHSEGRYCHRFHDTCPRWEEWGHWQPCSVPLGGTGTRKRYRTCLQFDKIKTNVTIKLLAEFLNPTGSQTDDCPGGPSMAVETSPCINDSCAGQWTEWGEWSRVSMTCGRGFKERHRQCLMTDNITPGVCIGSNIDIENVINPPCWGEWRTVSPCTVSCGGGTYQLQRECVGRTRLFKKCSGLSEKTETCNQYTCPWDNWSSYSLCSITCGGVGMSYSTRKCLKPGYCIGPQSKSTHCGYMPCPHWKPWTGFSCCSVSCGNGYQRRTRVCSSRTFEGTGCVGKPVEYKTCSMPSCDSIINKNVTCGLSKTAPKPSILRIINGRSANEYEWPWLASLQFNSCHRGQCSWEHICGAAIIHPRFVVTAAHCIEDISNLDYQYRQSKIDLGLSFSVVAGTLTIGDSNSGRMCVKRIHSHREYRIDKVLHDNVFQEVVLADVALVELNRPLSYGHNLAPLCLPRGEETGKNKFCFVAGWGFSNKTSERIMLQTAKLKTVDLATCNTKYGNVLNGNNHLCAAGESGEDTCEGDSGSPLMCMGDKGTWYLAGVTSYGIGNCSQSTYGVYSSITNFEDWITSIIKS